MPWQIIADLEEILHTLIGPHVIEAGAILANYLNERSDKTILVYRDGRRISTEMHEFGSLVDDDCRIGANAVQSPGTLLRPATIARRLEFVEQNPIGK